MNWKSIHLYLVIFALLLGIIPVTVYSEPLTVQAGITVFGDPQGNGRAYVEFPFSVNRSQFLFEKVENEDWYRAAIYAQMVLSDTSGNPVDTASTFFYTRVNDSAEVGRKDIKLFNKLTMMIAPGVYKGQLTVIDADSKREGAFQFNRLEIEPIQTNHLSLSNIELAYRIRMVDSSQGQSRMVKNNREILTSPMGIFSESDSTAYIYAELYNLKYENDKPDSFNIAFKAYDERGELYYDFGSINLKKPGESAVISNVLDIKDWGPGKYDLRVTATDYGNGESDAETRRIIIFPKTGALATAASYQYRSPLDTASIQTLSNLIKYIVDANDYVIYEGLTETGKLRFVKQFFADKDPTPNTPRNEYLEDAFQRYAYANREFSTLPGANDGWRRDRGRVLMQYGVPSEIEDAVSPTFADPWQIWNYYQLQGGVYFVFEDEDGYGDYRLVHSTATGEVYDQQWEDRIKGFGAEKYMGD